MRSYHWFLLAAASLLVLSFGATATAASPPSPPLVQSADEPSTIWGGQHVELEFTKDGGTLEFDCATGTITKPLAVDAHGKFRVSGTFTRERPGPTMRDGNPAASATYSGSVEGDTMHLTVVAGQNKESMGEYVLVRGQPGHVMKCR